MKYHKTNDGRKIKIADLETSHLENIIKWINKKAKEGLTVREGGGHFAEDMWCDEHTYFGNDAKHILNFSHYEKEYYNRINKNDSIFELIELGSKKSLVRRKGLESELIMNDLLIKELNNILKIYNKKLK